VLSLEVHRELAALVGAINRVIAAATERVPIEELELRIAAARTSERKLEAMTGSTFGLMGRHLGFLERNHRRGHPESSDGDIADLRDRDLPAAVEAVTKWTERLLDPGLVAAIARTWEAQDYDGVVRDAFNELEARMKPLATTNAGEQLFGRRLVNRLFDPAQLPAMMLGEQGFMGQLAPNQLAAAREFVGGAFGLFRNTTAHRAMPYARDEAADVVHLVNLCLRLVEKMR